MSTPFERTVLAEMEAELEVMDVYFNRGTLYVMNTYDYEAVVRWINEHYPGLEIQLEDDVYTLDCFDPYTTVNS